MPELATGASDEKARRREEILAAAFALLVERGYARTSMLAIAERARASKETLYAWFGNKEGLFQALIRHNAAGMNRALEAALAAPGADVRAVLERFGVDLLTLLTGERAVALNRAAIAEATGRPGLGRILVERGRLTTGPLVVAFIERQRRAGALACEDAEAAFEALLGLLVGDWQVRRLLGEMAAPGEAEIRRRAAHAVTLFLRLYGR